MFVRRGPAIVLSLVLGAAALVNAPGALARDGGAAKDVDKDGCNGSSSSTYKLKVVAEDGRLTVTASVWSDDEDIWDWVLRHNGDVSAQNDVRAKDKDKSFKITRTMVDLAGPDTVVFRTENRHTGEVCRASAEV